jgi:hypothetical protein
LFYFFLKALTKPLFGTAFAPLATGNSVAGGLGHGRRSPA